MWLASSARMKWARQFRRDVPGHPALRFSRAGKDAGGYRVRDHSGACNTSATSTSGITISPIHGANLSLSIPHNVRNYACGRTPVCNECERLVNSGVVVVAAAGNHGYQNFQTKEGIFESYAAFSITDPGNADGVITVGATHGGLAPQLWRQLLLEPRPDRRRPPEAGPRRARRTRPIDRSKQGLGIRVAGPAWRPRM